jgi:hypothetical protein
MRHEAIKYCGVDVGRQLDGLWDIDDEGEGREPLNE